MSSSNGRQVVPLARDLGMAAGSEALVFAGSIILIGAVGRLLGERALGEYLLVRRVCSWLQSGALLGLGVAIARYTAHTKQADPEQISYFISGTACLIVVQSALALVLCASRSFFATWFFGNVRMRDLILPVALSLLAGGAHAGIYAFYRGTLQIAHATALQCCNLAAIPLLVIALLSRTGSIALILNVTGVLSLFIAGVFAIPIARQATAKSCGRLLSRASVLLRYGTARLPGDFGLAALLSAGPIIASHFVPVTELSALLLGTSLLVASSISSAPLGMVLLSKVSRMVAEGRMDDVRCRLEYLFWALVDISLFICFQTLIFADVAIRLWIGKDIDRPGVVRTLALAIPFYLFFTGVRSAIDAATPTAFNARNVCVSVAVFGGLATVVCLGPAGRVVEGIAMALVLAMAILAVLTLRIMRRLYGIRVACRPCLPGLVLALVTGVLSLALRWATAEPIGPAALLSIEALACAVFLLTQRQLRTPWFAYVCASALARSERALPEVQLP